jgi:hypothetical protein
VKSYDGPFTTKFGDFYILLCFSDGDELEESFKLYATKHLTKYINEREPTKIFNFIVKEKDGKKYPFIEGYVEKRKWIVLE